MGSGTTGVSCKNLNRNFIGIELDSDYFKIAEKRINAPAFVFDRVSMFDDDSHSLEFQSAHGLRNLSSASEYASKRTIIDSHFCEGKVIAIAFLCMRMQLKIH